MDASTALPETPGHARSWTGGAHRIPAPVTAVMSSGDGHLWLAGPDRLVEFDGHRFRSFEVVVGTSTPTPLLEDADGHVWVGTSGEGALRFARSGFLTFTEAEGTSGAFVGTFQTRDKQTCAFTADGVVSCYEGERFVVVGSPSSWKNAWFVGARTVLEDRENQWWMTTSRGLHRFRPGVRLADLPRVQPLRTYTSRDGLPSDDIARLYEDSRGDIWVGTFEPNRRVVARWERATDRLVTYADAPGLPAFTRPQSFAEDRSGTLWIGLAEGGLVRHRNSRFELFAEDDGIPPGDWTSVHVDRAGRLWVATSGGGVLRVDKPDVLPLEGKRYTTVQGLVTDDVFSLTEDTQGRIYLGTSRGLDRLDPDT
ncbi:MAG: ligand-binding sensor domain-containing protein [Vicinamibacteraceae bacterium]